jgi:hypothetical protein
MDDKMLTAILAKITANQYAALEMIALLGVGSGDEKKEIRAELVQQALARSEDYYNALLPEFLKGAGLNE